MSTIGPKPVILCVDDEPMGLLMRKLLLESQGYRVLAAANGAEGLSLFAAERVDLVLLDYMMPDMDGGQVAQKMRGANPAVPLVLLSAYVDLPPEVCVLVDRYVTKGRGPEVLLATVAELLSGSKASASQAG